jgi:DNA-binding NtrC family response regulator
MERQVIRVLAVEDNVDDARLLHLALEEDGLAVWFERAWTREMVEDRLTKGPAPDIVLADYALPDLGALTVLELLHDAAVDIPVIVVTGTIGEELAVECMRRGATDYLLKDRLARLGPAVRQALRGNRDRREKASAERSLRERLRFEALLAELAARLIDTAPEAMDSALVRAFENIAKAGGRGRATPGGGRKARRRRDRYPCAAGSRW